MPRHRLDTDLVQADVDAAFALLGLAEAQWIAGDRDGARQALDDAERAWLDARRRFMQLDDMEVPPFRPQVRKLGNAVAEMKTRFE